MSSATAIQAVYVRGHEERPEPKPHIVFRIDIQAHVRSWQMWRRYSEFVDLHTELTKSVGAPPPSSLPPKHALAMLRPLKNQALLEERRAGLEAYLRAIVSAKDSRWLDAFAFRDFLGVPMGKQPIGGRTNDATGSVAGGRGEFTSSSWLDEHTDVQTLVRDIRADVNRRDAFSDRGDVGQAHATNVQAKKKLAGALTRVGGLVAGLDALALRGMSEGELQRRTDLVARVQDDCEKLAQMLTVARHTSRALPSAPPAGSSSDRAALLGGVASAKPIARVFGVPQPPKETEETRPLDDHGLLQLQQVKMDQQDAQVAQLATILQRQKQLGMAINNELAQHIELLDGLSNDMDRVGGKLTAAKKQLNRLG
jgi:regulator of vacuolar morphogenesis